MIGTSRGRPKSPVHKSPSQPTPEQEQEDVQLFYPADCYPLVPLPVSWLKVLWPFSAILFGTIFIVFGVMSDQLQTNEIQEMAGLQTSKSSVISFFKGITFFGESTWYVLVIIITFTGPYMGTPAFGRRLLLVVAICLFWFDFLKVLFNRARPYWLTDTIKAYECDPDSGMPSVHASGVILVFMIFGFQLHQAISSKEEAWGSTVTTLLHALVWHVVLFFIISVGLSRIYLGVHFPYQVGAGYCLGFFTLITIGSLGKIWANTFDNWLSHLSISGELIFWFVLSLVMYVISAVCFIAINQADTPSSWTDVGSIQCAMPVVDPRDTYWDMCSLAGALFGAMAGDALARRYVPVTWYICIGPLSQFIRMALTIGVAIAIIELWGEESKDGPLGLTVVFRSLLRYAVTTFVVFFISPLLSAQFRKCHGYSLKHDLSQHAIETSPPV